ncbi:ATP synthase B/B' CF(0) [Nitrosomonas eutropha]|uniref:ATP synthase B/B' CF(0) n=1 Tax=Nitrosomonas eutropha TaxID=916 RepID=A0A1I7G9G7_9PROT|nr:hypothetical protein [Nitrosomonas eutropha]SFU45094.1 ATP synthase B/B' CF(0) [Nitrosomonas eutropha]
MKFLYLSVALIMSLSFSGAFAEESLIEKLDTQTDNMKRSTNKAINRAKEAACTDSEAECLKQKAKNRANETYDAAKDKASEIKNKID